MAGASPDIPPSQGEKDYVNVERCARILGVSWTTVRRLTVAPGYDGKPLIEMVDYRRGKRVRILYSSIVHFCDQLRDKFEIADRRPPLCSTPLFRSRDEDLLPFPLSDTIYSREALDALGYENVSSLKALIKEGRFDAYKLVGGKGWRISHSSFTTFLHRAQHGPSKTKQPYACARPLKCLPLC
jgi:hypothetical protein